ncbi:tetratricopeptide repeat protein [Alteromonas macleodii]|uniref:tetratricopeptide repeat protein n=1 Tax=Alteromonas macleodii TaxID=28108 RepID=UPI003BF889AD
MNTATRQPRHLPFKDSELKSNNRFLSDGALLLPDGEKLHKAKKSTSNFNEYCLDCFNQDAPSLIHSLKTQIVQQHEKAMDLSICVNAMINSRIPFKKCDIQVGLLEIEKLLMPCVKQKYLDSIYELALLYQENGRFIDKTEDDYLGLIYTAVKNNHSDAPFNLAVHYLKKEDWRQAEEALLKGYKRANPLCVNKLAEMAEHGVTQKFNEDDAPRLYKRAMRYGLPIAAVNYARLIIQGIDKQHCIEDAIGFLEEAAKDGEIKAMFQLGGIYEDGLGVPIDYDKSLFFYKQASDGGDPNAQVELANIYRKLWAKFGIDKQDELAIELYKKAAEQGQPEAIKSLYIIENSINA